MGNVIGRAGRDRASSDCCLIISNDNPVRTRRLLDPSTPLSEIAEIVRQRPGEEQDDITRMLYFHVQAFKGAAAELDGIRAVIDQLEDLQTPRTYMIPFSRESRNEREKAVHRLVILGVVEDYTVEYAHDRLKLRLSGGDRQAILGRYLSYVRTYSTKQAEAEERKSRRLLNLEHREFVEQLAGKLVHFIYSTIERGRRRSLAAMLQAVSNGTTDRDVRQHILNYLELSAISELLDAAREHQSPLAKVLAEIGEQVAAPNEAAELRGQTARMLESYPNNPALLIIRAMAELMCRDRDVDIAERDLRAGATIALSESGWALETEEVCSAVATLAVIAARIDHELGPAMVNAFLSMHGSERDHARILTDMLEPELAYPAAEKLIKILDVRLGRFLGEVADDGRSQN